ncbi:MAG: hypothetical protein AVDCRST_MAG89-2030 [uncultured Gemmatimonadetes bacterium]|uniref:Uncharacterized protein n=1 Tax=uncultured Gemmatimonadota bacterium TaxID=203437 RepID=A0A6J4LDP0_9BACT|nr:MAG: hypothetical protein AVDCRST_MAG89-2030 [uncultured Gemmatimonadota bacterium]
MREECVSASVRECARVHSAARMHDPGAVHSRTHAPRTHALP